MISKTFSLRWYGPNNATLTVGGDVKTADVVKLVEKYYGNIPRCPDVQKVIVPSAHIDADRYASYTDNYARLPLLSIVYPTVPNYDKDIKLHWLAWRAGFGPGQEFCAVSATGKKSNRSLQAKANNQLSGTVW